MKFSVKRAVLAGAIGLAAIATPISLSVVLPQLGNGPAAFATSLDVINYVQTTGNTGTYIQYVPGNGTKPTNQAVTGGGGCGTPTVKNGPPILGFSAKLFASNTYSGSSSTAIVGAYKQRTGVCAIPQDWSIDNVTGTGAEALDFSVGTNPVIGSNRVFAEAKIALEREDKGSATSIPVQLIETLGGNFVATQTCTITGPAGTDIQADSGLSPICTGTAAGSFDTVEIRVPNVGTAVSVVGPTSSFTLANVICGGQSITSTGNIAAVLTLPPGAGCKSYTGFFSTYSGTPGDPQTVTFNAYSAGAVPFTVVIPWAPQPDCQPSASTASQLAPLPLCTPTQFSFDGVNFMDQSFCSQATAADPLCTTNKVYNYISVGGTDQTQITETWNGLIDWVTRH